MPLFYILQYFAHIAEELPIEMVDSVDPMINSNVFW
jgi:hypothetical protein